MFPRRIGIDARAAFADHPRGAGRNLLDALRAVARLRPDLQIELYRRRTAPPEPARALLAAFRNLRDRPIEMPGDRFDAWFQLRLPWAARLDGVDLLHLPLNAAPAWRSVPYVVTIHDLIPLHVRDEAGPRDRERFRRGVLRAVRSAAHILTVSEQTRAALRREFDVPFDRMSVVPWAPDALIAAPTDPESARRGVDRVRERYGLERPWLLNFSGASPRKNAAGVLRGLAHTPEALRRQYTLVMVGCEPQEFRHSLGRLASALGVAGASRVLGFVPHDDLPALVRGAKGVLLPSLEEGFGLPILDAFACRVPVLTSDRGAMREVAGDAAVFCDPRDAHSIAAGLARLVEDGATLALRRRAAERVRSFTWERTARGLLAAYERATQTALAPAPAADAREAALGQGATRLDG